MVRGSIIYLSVFNKSIKASGKVKYFLIYVYIIYSVLLRFLFMLDDMIINQLGNWFPFHKLRVCLTNMYNMHFFLSLSISFLPSSQQWWVLLKIRLLFAKNVCVLHK